MSRSFLLSCAVRSADAALLRQPPAPAPTLKAKEHDAGCPMKPGLVSPEMKTFVCAVSSGG